MSMFENPPNPSGPLSRLSRILTRELKRRKLVPTRTCNRFLGIACEKSGRKTDNPWSLSCTSVFLTALTEDFSLSTDDIVHPELDIIDVINDAIQEQGATDDLAQYTELYFGGSTRENAPTELTGNFRQALELLDNTDSLTLPALLRAVLSVQKSALRDRLARIGIDANRLLASMPITPLGPSGTGSYMVRTPKGEPPILSAGAYANAIESVMRSAPAEFCFALFGSWGSGKSRLVSDCLEPRLKRTRPGGEHGYNGAYEVAYFSAWKYPHAPESWIAFYETLLSLSGRASIVTRVRRILRTLSFKHGYDPFLLAGLMLLLVVTAAPVLALFLLLGFAVAGAAWLASTLSIFAHGRDLAGSVAKRYAGLPTHRDKLGMQALIGRDLLALLVGWMPQKGDYAHAFGLMRKPFLPLLILWGLAAGALTLILGPWQFQWLTNATDACGMFGGDAGELCTSISSALIQPQGNALAALIRWLGAAALLAMAAGFSFATWIPRKSPQRLLIVVEDLDRCTADVALTLIESLKLLLEEPEIQERVQIIVLADEDVLRHATAEKFKGLMAARADGETKPSIKAEVLEEHFEKLFTCHLRLSNITRADIRDLVELYTSYNHTRPETAVTPRQPQPPPSPPREPIPPPRPVPFGRVLRSILRLGPNADEPRLEPNLYGEPERWALAERLATAFEEARRRASPRAIRMFLFKYQLARAILRFANVTPQPTADEVVTALIDASSKDPPNVKNVPRDTLLHVAYQVR